MDAIKSKGLSFMQKGRADLLEAEPWVAYGAFQLELVPSSEVKTAAVDGERILFNPEYVTTLRTDKVPPLYWTISIVEHETWHPMLGHCRDWSKEADKDGEPYDPLLVNIAQDYVINMIIESSGRRIHPTWVNGQDDPMRGKFGPNQPWTEIYMTLKERRRRGAKLTPSHDAALPQPDPVPGGKDEDDDGKPDGVFKGKSTGNDREGVEERNNWGQIVQEATEFASGQGRLPGRLADLARKVAVRPVDWKTILARHFSRMRTGDYSYRKPNRHYMHTGIVMPVNRTFTSEPLLVLDTSGSCVRKIPQFLGHVCRISRECRVPLWVVCTDAKVYEPQLLKRPEDYGRIKVHGGGGTNFVPFFDWLRRRRHDLVVFFTDGQAVYPKRPPSCSVVWCIPGGAKTGRIVPFGTQLNLPENL